MSVLMSDCLVFGSALLYYIRSLKLASKHEWVFFALCTHPGLTLIDYGHFQYNCVSLGLALWAIGFLCRGRYLLAAVAFSAALNYKQMELYHALPIFFYLLSICQSKAGLSRQLLCLLQIGTVTLATFATIWYPFLQIHDGLLQQVVSRLFPFHRGIFEDYVANFWCCLNVIVKIRKLMDMATLARYCLLFTAAFSVPCSLHLYFKTSFRNLLLSLVNVSMAFFLFSYHVHEKSILLVTLPVSLAGPYMPLTAFWFLCIAHFSMLPLYAKDEIVLPALVVLCLYALFAHSSLRFAQISSNAKFLAIFSASTCTILSVAFFIIPSPTAYPYLWTLLVSLSSFLHFVMFFAYFIWLQFWCGAQSLKLKLN